MKINPNLIEDGKILWENPNPTANKFTAQNITLSSSDYNYYEVFCVWSSAVNRTCSTGLAKKGTGCIACFVSSHSFYRTFNYSTDTEISVGAGTEIVITSGASSTNNEWFIPIMVIGYNKKYN